MLNEPQVGAHKENHTMMRHIIIKLLEINIKAKILKSEKEKKMK